ncbi:MAG: 6-phosphogluconolactonase [Pseudomonadota bacterium]
MNITEYADREMLQMQVADVLAGELRDCLSRHDHASFAVPGGTTPGPIFDLMSGADLEWARVHVMLTDERWVDEGSDQSNTALVKQRLLTGHARDARFVPFYAPGMSAEAGIAHLAPGLAQEMPLSLLVLGMGADMHTASLFPGGAGLEAAMAPDAPLLCAVAPASGGVARVTLPAHALAGAMRKHLVIYGEDKRDALMRAQSLPPEEAPIAAVMGGGRVHWAA